MKLSAKKYYFIHDFISTLDNVRVKNRIIKLPIKMALPDTWVIK
jgi:hypothetical protein